MKQVFTSDSQVKLGDLAPNFRAVDKGVKDVFLYEIKAKRKVILSVPSVDTEVCSLESKTFSEKLKNHPDLELIVVSLDLPFAQNRWCGLNKVDNVTMLSDYKYHDFAEKFGLKLKNLGLLGRSVMVLDKENKVEYLEVCKNVPDHPDYKKVFKFLSIE